MPLPLLLILSIRTGAGRTEEDEELLEELETLELLELDELELLPINEPELKATRTSSLIPSNRSAKGFDAICVAPLEVHCVPFSRVPVWELPEESSVTPPSPSSNFQKPSRSVVLPGTPVDSVATSPDVSALPYSRMSSRRPA